MKTLREQLDSPILNPSHPALTAEQTETAVKNNLHAYPEVIRSLNDPVQGNNFVLLSFLEGVPEHGQEAIRFIKVRDYGNLNFCTTRAKEIIQNTDSRIPIAIAKIGAWCRFTTDPSKFSSETINVIDGKDCTTVSDAASKLAKEFEQKKEDEEQEKEIARQRRSKVLAEADSKQIKFYILNKVKLFETNKQIKFITKKLECHKKRAEVLSALISKQSDMFEEDWHKKYMDMLMDEDVTKSDITVEVMKELEHVEDKKLLDLSLDELKKIYEDICNQMESISISQV